MTWVRRSTAIIQGELMTASFLTQAIVDNPNALRDQEVSGVLVVFADTADIETGDGAFYFTIPDGLDGRVLVTVNQEAITAGTTGTQDMQIHNVTQVVDILSILSTLDSGETSTRTAAIPAVINPANDDAVAGEVWRVDIDDKHTTPSKGLKVELGFAYAS